MNTTQTIRLSFQSSVRLCSFNPLTCNVKDDERNGCVFEIAGNQGSKSFLAGCVPELESKDVIAEGEIFGHEIDADGCLELGVVYA